MPFRSVTKKTRVLFSCAMAPLLTLTFCMPAQAADMATPSGIVLSNDRTVDCSSHQSIAKAIWHDDMNEQQKSYAMWRFFMGRFMHKEDAGLDTDGGNAVEHFTKTGYCVCGQWASLYAGCMADNGMTATVTGLNGHNINGVQYWGDWHAYDIDMCDLYVWSNGIVANPGDIKRAKDADGKYVFRSGAPIKSFPWYLGPDSIADSISLYANVSIGAPVAAQTTRKWNYNLSLRPGQEIIWSWYGDPDVGFVCLSHLPDVRSKKNTKSLHEYLEGDYDYYQEADGKPKWNWGYRRGGLRPNPIGSWNGNGGNGRLTMDLAADGFRNAQAMATAWDNLEVKDGKLALMDATQSGTFTLEFGGPYIYGDAWVEKPLPEKGLKIELIYDDHGPRTIGVYPGGVSVDDGKRIRFFDQVRRSSSFSLKVTLDAGTPALAQFKAIGAFYLCNTVLPAAVKGKNQISLRLANPQSLATQPLHVTYVYDQVNDDHKIMHTEKVFTFGPDSLTQSLDTGDKHWPLMREIRMRCGGATPKAPAPAEEKGELDWAAAPWDWIYNGVNFWNDFERGDRQGWSGQLTTKNTFNGSDFSLDNSLMQTNGLRQLKLIRFGSFLNRDTKFKCQLWVKNISKLSISTRNQDPGKKAIPYYAKTFTNLKDGVWQPFEVAMNALEQEDNSGNKVQNNWFLSNIYMQVWPADGKENKDVEFMIDNAVCWDGELKIDPCSDPDAAKKSLADDPIWNAKKPEPKAK